MNELQRDLLRYKIGLHVDRWAKLQRQINDLEKRLLPAVARLGEGVMTEQAAVDLLPDGEISMTFNVRERT